MFKDCQCEDGDPSPAKCGSTVDLGDWLEESFPDFTTVAEVATLAVDMISKPQAGRGGDCRPHGFFLQPCRI